MVKFFKPHKKRGSQILILISFLMVIPGAANYIGINYRPVNDKDQIVKSAGIWATLDLNRTSSVNGSEFTHGTLIKIQGRLFNRIGGDGKPGYTVAIEVNDIVDSNFNDITDSGGYFQIDYTINPSLDIYSTHKIEATVIDSTPDNVEYRTHYMIDVNTTSFFDYNEPFQAKLLGEFFDFDFDDYLRYFDGTGIPFSTINYFWYNGPAVVDNGVVSTDGSGLIQSLFIPDIGITNLELLLTYASPPEVGYSDHLYVNTKLFSNISCIWNLPSTIRASSNLLISGQVISRTNPSININNRMIDIYYNGSFVNSVQTNADGDFSVSYSLPQWTGQTVISIRLPNTLGKNIITRHFVTIHEPSTSTGPGVQAPPFLMFFSIFLPIIGVVIGGLAFYGYRYYKKQDKLSKVVSIPLESKIINLKILKDSGRLEESLSYLFNAIYMDLVGAKFGRIRKGNETIRDFAIVSVTNLNLSPATIYPFIQKVEEIIYAKPFQITDKEFYGTINLFSPVYFELTGYNFELNF